MLVTDWEVLMSVARYIRKKYKIPIDQIIEDKLEEEFRCKVVSDPDHPYLKNGIEISEKDYTVLLLKVKLYVNI